MLEKAEQGIWPTMAPTGYRNVVGAHGKRVIAVDPETARRYQAVRMVLARHVLAQAGSKARPRGRHDVWGSLNPISLSSVHKILRSRIYAGEFDWLGKQYQGSHEPLISVEIWERVRSRRIPSADSPRPN